MKLGVVVPLWGRAPLTRLTLRRISRETERDKECILVAITDEPWNGKQAEAFGFEVVSAPNSPLSNKKNAGIQYLRGCVDGVVLLGSDDWAIGLEGVSLLDRYRTALTEHSFVGPLDLWYLNLAGGAAGYNAGYTEESRLGEPVGVGRAIRAEVLDAVEWEPRPPRLLRNHDGEMRKRIKAAGFSCTGRTQEDLGVRIVDIKSNASITPFKRLKLSRKKWDTVLEPFPQEEVVELKSLVTQG